MRKIFKLVLLVSVSSLFLSACGAPRGLDHRASRPSHENLDVPQSTSLVKWSEEVSSMPVGQSVKLTIDDQTYLIEIGEKYTNALGESCRRLHLKAKNDRMTKEAAVCKTSEGQWRYVEPLL